MDKFLIKKRKCVEGDVDKIQDEVRKTCIRKIWKPCLYSEDYIKLDFTFSGNVNNPCFLCLVCGDKLGNESMVPNKLKRHFTSKYGHLSEKPVEYFIQLSNSIKNQSTAFTKRMKTSDKAQEASYLVAQIIAKNKELHTNAETTIMQSYCAIVRTIFGSKLEREVSKFL